MSCCCWWDSRFQVKVLKAIAGHYVLNLSEPNAEGRLLIWLPDAVDCNNCSLREIHDLRKYSDRGVIFDERVEVDRVWQLNRAFPDED